MYEQTVLNNGLRVITAPIRNAYSVSISFLVGAGSRNENNELAGGNHFLEHLLFKGTRNWPSAQIISEAIEGVGGVMNASTDKEMTVYWSKIAQPHFNTAFDVLTDMFINPLLDESEMNKEREVINEELRMTNDYPSYQVELLIDEMLWPGQPMGRDVGGTLESVSQIKRNDLVDLMSSHYTPNNVVIAVAGNVDHSRIVNNLLETTKEWLPRSSPKYEAAIMGQHSKVSVQYRKSEQAHICVGLPSHPLGHPDHYAMNIVNIIFGEGMSSRLFMEVREKRGLAYDVHSGLSEFSDSGAFVIYCGSAPNRSTESLHVILGELNRLLDGFSEEEICKAKEYWKGRLMLRLENTQNVSMWYGAQELLLNKISEVEETAATIDSIDVEDINRVARELVMKKNVNLAVVGPFKSDRKFQAAIHN
mgnify:CR=1 FL=1